MKSRVLSSQGRMLICSYVQYSFTTFHSSILSYTQKLSTHHRHEPNTKKKGTSPVLDLNLGYHEDSNLAHSTRPSQAPIPWKAGSRIAELFSLAAFIP